MYHYLLYLNTHKSQRHQLFCPKLYITEKKMIVWTFCIHWEALKQQIIKAKKINNMHATTSYIQLNRYNLVAMLHWPYYPAPNIYALLLLAFPTERNFSWKIKESWLPTWATKAVWFKVSKHPSTDLWTCLAHVGCSCCWAAGGLLCWKGRSSFLTNPCRDGFANDHSC